MDILYCKEYQINLSAEDLSSFQFHVTDEIRKAVQAEEPTPIFTVCE